MKLEMKSQLINYLTVLLLVSVTTLTYAEIIANGEVFPNPSSANDADISGQDNNGSDIFFNIGNTSNGQLIINNGSTLISNNGGLGTDVTGNGNVTVTGNGTTWNVVSMGSNTGALSIGSRGAGALNLDLNATLNSVFNGFNISAIGEFAGSIGTVTIKNGAQWIDQSGLNVGRGAICTAATCGGFVAGIPGATTRGTLNIESNGFVNILRLISVAREPNAIGAINIRSGGKLITPDNLDLGSDFNTDDDNNDAAIFVTGSGSQLQVGGETGSILHIANGANGELTVENNAEVTVKGFEDNTTFSNTRIFLGFNSGDGEIIVRSGGKIKLLEPSSATEQTAIRLGGSMGVGQITVSDPNSMIELDGNFPWVDVGLEAGTGLLTLSNGALLSLKGIRPRINVSRDQNSNGNLTLSGNGTKITFDASNELFFNVGIDNGRGTIMLSDQAEIKLNADSGAFFDIGRRGGEGEVIVDNANILLENASNFPSSDGDDPNVQLHVGRENNAIGTLTLTNNSKIELKTPSIGDGSSILNVGSQTSEGSLVIQNNSQFIVDGGRNPRLFLGRAGNGIANINSGGMLIIRDLDGVGENSGIQIGGTFNDPGGIGTLNIADSNSRISIIDDGSFINVGSNGGVGTLNVNNGASVELQGGSEFAAILIGRRNAQGDMTIDNATVTLEVTAAADEFSAFVGVGRESNSPGTLTIQNGGTFELIDPDNEGGGLIGSAIDANGIVLIDGTNSLLDANSFLGVGLAIREGTGFGSPAFMDAGTGVLTLANNGEVRANQIQIGTPGTLQGHGLVTGNVINKGGTVAPGSSPGTLTIDGDYRQASGVLEIEIAGLNPGQFDLLDVSGNIDIIGGVIRFIFINGFAPQQNDSISFVKSSGTVDIASSATFEFSGLQSGFQFNVGDTSSSGGGREIVFTAQTNGQNDTLLIDNFDDN